MKPILHSLSGSKPCLIAVIFILCTIGGWGQQRYSREFGVVSRNEFDLSSYEADPEAEAIVLFDIGQAVFQESTSGFDIQFTRIRRLKILSGAGTEYSQIEIPYYEDGFGKTEQVDHIEAYTYNLLSTGIEKTPLDKEAIFDEQKSKYYRVKKFAFPKVKAGSVIEYRYELTTPFKFNLPDWEFQSRIPTIFSQYTVKMIPFYEYVYLRQGEAMSRQESYEENGLGRSFNGIPFKDYVHVFEREHIPAFRDESYISSINDYIAKIDFQLSKVHQTSGAKTEIITTWPALISELLDHPDFGKYVKKASKLAEKEILPQLSLEGKSSREKCQIIVDYMKQHFQWDNYYGKYASQDPKDLLLKKEGNAADLNLFTVGALQAAGVQADPVILSTRDHGKISSSYPFNHYFNFVVVLSHHDGLLVLSDASEPLLPFDQIPPFCINEYGLIVAEGASWVTLEALTSSFAQYTINLNLQPGSPDASLLVSGAFSNLKAYQNKRRYTSEEKVISDFEEGDVIEVNKVKIFDNNQLYRISFDGSTRLETFQDQLLISPFLNLPPQKNMFRQAQRNYPVDFIYKSSYKFQSIIQVPPGYKVSFVPEDLSLSNALFDIRYTVQSSESRILTDGSIVFKKAVYDPEDYAELKAGYENIVRKFNEKIVITNE